MSRSPGGKAAAIKKLTPRQEAKAARLAAPVPKSIEDEPDDDLGDALRALDLFGMIHPLYRAKYRMDLIPKIAPAIRDQLAQWKNRWK